MRTLKAALLLTLLLLTASLYLHGQVETGAICVAPNAAEAPQRCAPGLCASGELSYRLDKGSVHPWPKAESLKIDELSIEEPHRVVIYRAKKTQQSFTFRFSDFKSRELCLFLNDLYWTAQPWEQRRAPWCKCK